MALRMQTSRRALDRLLDPTNRVLHSHSSNALPWLSPPTPAGNSSETTNSGHGARSLDSAKVVTVTPRFIVCSCSAFYTGSSDAAHSVDCRAGSGLVPGALAQNPPPATPNAPCRLTLDDPWSALAPTARDPGPPTSPRCIAREDTRAAKAALAARVSSFNQFHLHQPNRHAFRHVRIQ